MSHWYDLTPKKSRRKRDSNPGPSALEADALTTRPTRRYISGTGTCKSLIVKRCSLNSATFITRAILVTLLSELECHGPVAGHLQGRAAQTFVGDFSFAHKKYISRNKRTGTLTTLLDLQQTQYRISTMIYSRDIPFWSETLDMKCDFFRRINYSVP